MGNEYKDDVLLIDCDLSFGTAALTCNVEPKQNVADALAQPGRLDETLVERVKIKVDDFFSLIPAPATLSGDYEIEPESFEQLLRIARSMASYVILDLPHHWSPWVQDVMLDADEVVLVTTPDLAGMRDTKNISDAIKGGPKDGIKLVMNKVGMARKTEISGKDFENQIEISPAINVPFDSIIFGNAMNNGEMLAKISKGGKVLPEITKLARMVSGAEPLSKSESKARAKKMKSQKRSGFSALKFAR
jgi:pilus assembly protein CpaE